MPDTRTTPIPRRHRPLLAVATATVTGLASTLVPQPATAEVDVYTTPGEHLVNSRRWRTECEPYSSNVDRCRTEIWSSTVEWTGSRYVVRQAWVFNNLTYLPSIRENWAGNPLATPGEHLIAGRRWKTECDTAWTGRNGCRSMIWAGVPQLSGSSFVTKSKWVFNNIVRFLPPGSPAPPPRPLNMVIPRQIDPLATATVAGRLNTGEVGATVVIEVRNGTTWSPVATTRTAADGRWSVPWSYGVGVLGTTTLRAKATTARGAVALSLTSLTTRMRWANPTITRTTAAEVAATYRVGCPVGPSRLRTIRINQQGLNGKIYRGEIIVRDDLANRVVNVFSRTLQAGFPVAQMRNPNLWGGSDKAMMAANNTSAFNCRPVVGNPYAQSPHSYGIAVDLNPVQNPYRDPTGTWWPSTKYVSRSPVVPGMLTSGSAPVVAFRDNSFEWYSGWDWHHFQYKAGYGPASRVPGTTPTSAPGRLTEADLLVPKGWSGRPAITENETGIQPDGAWSHVVDAGTKSRDILTLACATSQKAPQPVAAIEGTLKDAAGRDGVAATLAFDKPADAKAWFTYWRSSAGGCKGTTALTSTEEAWTAHRDLGSAWSEAATRVGTTVRLVTVNQSLPAAELLRITRD